MPPLLRLLRPHQWIKNSFVFAGIIFAHEASNFVLLQQVIIVACAFSLLSSAMYIVNDFFDRTADRLHPLKKSRPIAAGTVSTRSALTLALFLILAGLVLATLTTTTVVWILLSYLLLNIIYSYWLKNVVYWDVIAIAVGFLLRILTGTTGIGIPPSIWILICSFSLTLFLGFTKRRVEQQVLKKAKIPLPKGLQQYQPYALNVLVACSALCTVLSYLFYALYQATLMDQKFIYTVPLVAFGIFRYLYLSYQMHHGSDIARDLFRDQYLLATVVLWLIIIIGV